MRTVGFMALHYGADYLAYAIESIIDAVDVLHIAYTPEGSHGTRSPVACPESQLELQTIARRVAGRKLRWHMDTWPHEGAQRDMIYQYEPDADIIVVVDSDEVWHGDLLRAVLKRVPSMSYRSYRIPMVHFWRGFSRAIVDDFSFPDRIICPKNDNNPDTGTIPREWGVISHFGYAIRPDLMRYKWLIHGHRAHYRQGWLDSTYLSKERVRDLHPTNVDFWDYQVVEPLDYMPEWMVSHPFYDMEWIE